jgi:hypothetical protein
MWGYCNSEIYKWRVNEYDFWHCDRWGCWTFGTAMPRPNPRSLPKRSTQYSGLITAMCHAGFSSPGGVRGWDKWGGLMAQSHFDLSTIRHDNGISPKQLSSVIWMCTFIFCYEKCAGLLFLWSGFRLVLEREDCYHKIVFVFGRLATKKHNRSATWLCCVQIHVLNAETSYVRYWISPSAKKVTSVLPFASLFKLSKILTMSLFHFPWFEMWFREEA